MFRYKVWSSIALHHGGRKGKGSRRKERKERGGEKRVEDDK